MLIGLLYIYFDVIALTDIQVKLGTTWLYLLRYFSAARVWPPDIKQSTVSGWLWHILHFFQRHIITFLAEVSCIQYLVMCSYNDSIFTPLSPLYFIHLNDCSLFFAFLHQIAWELTMHCLLVMLLLHELFIFSLLLILQLLSFLFGSCGMVNIDIIYCSCLCQLHLSFLWCWAESLFPWCLKRAVIWISFFSVRLLCSPTIVVLYSFSRFISLLPPSWYSR